MLNIRKMITSAAVIVALTGTTAFAAPNVMAQKEDHSIKQHERFRHRHEKRAEYEKDPIKALEDKKAEVQRLLKEGKITQQQADEIIQKIDNRIKEVQAFQKLPLEQKKEKVIKDLQSQVDQLVKEGKMKQDEADQIMKKAKESIKKWDGTGFPGFSN